MSDEVPGNASTTQPQADHGPPRAPRWVKLLLLGLLAAVVLAVLAMFIVGGDHGPSRHGSHGLEEPANSSATVTRS